MVFCLLIRSEEVLSAERKLTREHRQAWDLRAGFETWEQASKVKKSKTSPKDDPIGTETATCCQSIAFSSSTQDFHPDNPTSSPFNAFTFCTSIS